MVCSPGSSVYEISQARVLEWVAIFLSRGSPQPRDQTRLRLLGRSDSLPLSHLGNQSLNSRTVWTQKAPRRTFCVWQENWETNDWGNPWFLLFFFSFYFLKKQTNKQTKLSFSRWKQPLSKATLLQLLWWRYQQHRPHRAPKTLEGNMPLCLEGLGKGTSVVPKTVKRTPVIFFSLILSLGPKLDSVPENTWQC